MKRENCPRQIDPKVYREKLKKIKFLSTKKSFKKLLDFEKVFYNRKTDTLNK